MPGKHVRPDKAAPPQKRQRRVLSRKLLSASGAGALLLATGLGIIALQMPDAAATATDNPALTGTVDCTMEHTATNAKAMDVTVSNLPASTANEHVSLGGNDPSLQDEHATFQGTTTAQGTISATGVVDQYQNDWVVGKTYYFATNNPAYSGTFVLTSDCGSGGGSTSSTPPPPKNPKVTFCHATPPETAKNGWNEQTVAADALFSAGHDGHDADIIPSFVYTDKNGDDQTYPGKNLSKDFDGSTGQQILANDCVNPSGGGTTVPPETSTPPAPTCTDDSKSVGSYSVNYATRTATVVLTDDLCTEIDAAGVGWDNKNPPATFPQINPTTGNGIVKIKDKGTYQVVAPDKCQGDFYADKGSAPKWPDQLDGPNNPYEPNFVNAYFSGTDTPWFYGDCTGSPTTTPPGSTPPGSTPPGSTPPGSTPPGSTTPAPPTSASVPPSSGSTTPHGSTSVPASTPMSSGSTTPSGFPPANTGDSGTAAPTNNAKLVLLRVAFGVGLLGVMLMLFSRRRDPGVPLQR